MKTPKHTGVVGIKSATRKCNVVQGVVVGAETQNYY